MYKNCIIGIWNLFEIYPYILFTVSENLSKLQSIVNKMKNWRFFNGINVQKWPSDVGPKRRCSGRQVTAPCKPKSSYYVYVINTFSTTTWRSVTCILFMKVWKRTLLLERLYKNDFQRDNSWIANDQMFISGI